MNTFTAIAIFGLTWLVASFFARYYLRYRRRTATGRDWQEYKARLPGWVKQIEMLFQIIFWLGLGSLWAYVFVTIHAELHPNLGLPKGLAFGSILFSTLLGALIPAMLLANLASWLVGPLKRANLAAFDESPTASFKDANLGLAKFGRVLVPLCLLVSVVGAYELWA